MKKSPFGFEKPKDSPGFLLWQTTTIWQRKIKKALEEYNISHAQFVVMAVSMWHKTQNLPAKQANIIHMSKLDKMTISKSLKQLEKKGYLLRVEDDEDSRAKNIILTKSGEELIYILIPIVEAIDEVFFQDLGSEQNKFHEFLHTLIKSEH